MGASAENTVVQSNLVHDNRNLGIYALSGARVIGNTVFGQRDYGGSQSYRSGIGVYVFNADAVGNEVYSNYDGVYAYGHSGYYFVSPAPTVAENRVYGNSNYGIYAPGDDSITNNVVYSNAVGIYSPSYSASEIDHNLVYGNADRAIDGGSSVTGNTVYQLEGEAIRAVGAVRDNIIWVDNAAAIAVPEESQHDFSSDYNLFYVAGSGVVGRWAGHDFATFEDWHFEVGFDEHSRAGDPRLVDPDGPDDSLGFSRRALEPAWIIDDGAPGFSSTGPWSLLTDAGLGGDYLEIPVGQQGEAAWTFAGLTPGEFYQVSVTWPQDPFLSWLAPYGGLRRRGPGVGPAG